MCQLRPLLPRFLHHHQIASNHHRISINMTQPKINQQLIRENQWVLLQMVNGATKLMQVSRTPVISLGRYGAFQSRLLVGTPFGQTYEVVDQKTLKVIPRDELIDRDMLGPWISDGNGDGPTANNQEIFDVPDVQRLSSERILELRNATMDGSVDTRELIETLAENNQSFEKKTDYSKSKYIKRKKTKFLKIIRVLEPTPRHLCEFYFEKQPKKIREMRFDSLALMLTLANVHAGSRMLIVDDTQGMLTAAVLHRMQGSGTVLTIHDGEASTLDILRYMPETDHQILHTMPWCRFNEQSEEDVNHSRFQLMSDERKEAVLSKITQIKESRQLLLNGGFDGLLIASKFDPISILDTLIPFIAGSRPVVFFHPNIEPLAQTYIAMRASDTFINVRMSDNWLRKYQVLPMRTHPVNNMSGYSGFVLSGTRVLSDRDDVPAATATAMEEKTEDGAQQKRAKLA